MPGPISPTFSRDWVSGLPDELRPEYRFTGGGRPNPLDLLTAVDTPNRVGFQLIHSFLSGKSPGEALLDLARAGGSQARGADILEDLGLSDSPVRDFAGRGIDAAADWTNLIPGLTLAKTKPGLVRDLFAAPLGAVIGQEGLGKAGEAIGGDTGRGVGEFLGGLVGAGLAGAKAERVMNDPATYRLGIAQPLTAEPVTIPGRGPKAVKNIAKSADAVAYPISAEELRGMYPELQVRGPEFWGPVAERILSEHAAEVPNGAGIVPRAQDPEKLTQLLGYLDTLAQLGKGAQRWYEDSGQTVMKLAQGDKAAAERIAELLAAGAQKMDPKANATTALRALSSYLTSTQAPEDFSFAGTQQMQKLFGDLLYGDKSLATDKIRKRSTFKGNLVDEILPEVAKSIYEGTGVRSTMDMVMNGPLVFGSGGNAPTPAQYKFYERIANAMGEGLGDELPHQTQARIWTGAQMLKDILEAQLKGKPLPSLEDLDRAKNVDFSHALARHLGQVSWELVPGERTGHLPELLSDPQLAREYSDAKRQAVFQDEDGNDLVARAVGLPTLSVNPLPGVWQGSVNPGTQNQAVMVNAQQVRKGIDPRTGKVSDTIPIPENYLRVDEPTRVLADADSAIRGLLNRQAASAWTRPMPGAKVGERDLVDLNFGRPLSEDETKQLYQGLRSTFGNQLDDQVAVISTPTGVWLKNLTRDWDKPDVREYALPNKDFLARVKKGVGEVDFPGAEPTLAAYGSDGSFIENNWHGEHANGEAYLDRIRATGRPDLLRATADLLDKAHAFDQRWAAERGHTFRAPERDLGAQLRAEAATLEGRAAAGAGSRQPHALYRGDSSPWQELDPGRLDPGALAGPGLYLTSSPEIAGSYTVKGTSPAVSLSQQIGAAKDEVTRALAGVSEALRSGGDAPTIKGAMDRYQQAKAAAAALEAEATPEGSHVKVFGLPANLRVLDLDAPVHPDVAGYLKSELGRVTGRPGYLDLPEGATGWDLWRALQNELYGVAGRENIPVQQATNRFLAGAGLHGLTHTGGIRAGDGSAVHDVVVLFPEHRGLLQPGIQPGVRVWPSDWRLQRAS